LGFLRNRVTAVGCVVAAAGLAASGCSDSGSGSGHRVVADAGTARSTSALTACSATFLAMRAGHRSGTTTVTQAMNLTNNGTAACVLDGYPGVNIIGRAHGQSQYTWTLRWATRPHAPVTLQPGATAHFDVVYQAATTAGGNATGAPTASGATSKAVAGKTGAAATPTGAASKAGTATGKAGATGRATPKAGGSASPASPPVDIDVLDITITLPNTYMQDQMAWNAEMVLEDKDANAQTHVTPFVAGAA